MDAAVAELVSKIQVSISPKNVCIAPKKTPIIPSKCVCVCICTYMYKPWVLRAPPFFEKVLGRMPLKDVDTAGLIVEGLGECGV